jgi:regulatory LuxR family protein
MLLGSTCAWAAAFSGEALSGGRYHPGPMGSGLGAVHDDRDGGGEDGHNSDDHGDRTNIQIARQLGLSEGTVRTHLENIYGRLQVSNRTAAVVRAFPGHVA